MNSPYEVHQPTTLEELAALLGARPSISLLGGGTAEVPAWQSRLAPREVVYLPAVRALRQQGDQWCGAAVTLAEFARIPNLPTALGAAATSIGRPAIRNIATVGGNLASGGPACLAVALLVFDATVDRLEQAPSPASTGRDLSEALSQPGPAILRVRWHVPHDARSSFHKFGMRPAGGPHLATVAVRWDGPDAAAGCAIAVGSTGVAPHRLPAAEAEWARLSDRPAAAAAAASAAAAATAMVQESRSAGIAYRRHLVGILVRRALLALTGHSVGGSSDV